ncbi:hypothetical protein H6P81_021489 [Aristolochia fimbriata]|uniref:Uncharacterized protein n=1 Tax=Aristolochia fimbriata TaxID=158543 RepID=A0AAV7DTH4_ARIFI|nr:hypothetical protein H6P81_021489 [Aristolochia fimbriata]
MLRVSRHPVRRLPCSRSGEDFLKSLGSGSAKSTLQVGRKEVVFSSVPQEVRKAALSTSLDIMRESTLSTLRFAISTLKTVDVSELWLRANWIDGGSHYGCRGRRS